MDKINEKEIDLKLKINIFVNDEKIKMKFLHSIKATEVFKKSPKSKLGAEFATLSYKNNKNFRLLFFLMSNDPVFNFIIPTYMKGSHGIIYFYQFNEKIEKDRLNLISLNVSPKTPILFVGYASNLPKNPEKIDPNISMIQNLFVNPNVQYFSVIKQDNMLQIVDRIINLNFNLGIS
ncbi:MAG: hypothetical protein ACTSWX_11350 [Promethearchaeota archaeon]